LFRPDPLGFVRAGTKPIARLHLPEAGGGVRSEIEGGAEDKIAGAQQGVI